MTLSEVIELAIYRHLGEDPSLAAEEIKTMFFEREWAVVDINGEEVE
jgi:hypothetical protein